MRFIPSILTRFFRPVPFRSSPSFDGENYSRADDPIARQIDAAVMEHERISVAAQRRVPAVASAIEDLLSRLERVHD
jgi:hypothetical protein